MNARIAILPGDGIGPEVTAQAVGVLEAVGRRFGHDLAMCEALIGGAALEATGDPLPAGTLKVCRDADAVLLGAVGGPGWADAPAGMRPEDGLLALRKRLGLFANLRPVKPTPAALGASPLKAHLLEGVDMLVVRELTGGIYFGAKHRSESDAYDLCSYTRREIERIVRVAAAHAQSRRGKLTSIDKANVLETSRLWRSISQRVIEAEFASLNFEHMLVDSAAMHLITRPADFDVVVSENMFGDILSDELSVLAGSLGMLPSASLGEGTFGLYEPVHGSAPDIAGQDVANPYGAILAAAMLLRLSLGLEEEAAAVESAVNSALDQGALTRDLARSSASCCTTTQAGQAVIDSLKSIAPIHRTVARVTR